MKKPFFLEISGIRKGVAAAAAGFLIYLLLSALKWDAVAAVFALLFGLWALFVFLSALAGRAKDPKHHSEKDISYSLLWGSGALTILLLGCGILGVKLLLGL